MIPRSAADVGTWREKGGEDARVSPRHQSRFPLCSDSPFALRSRGLCVGRSTRPAWAETPWAWRAARRSVFAVPVGMGLCLRPGLEQARLNTETIKNINPMIRYGHMWRHCRRTTCWTRASTRRGIGSAVRRSLGHRSTVVYNPTPVAVRACSTRNSKKMKPVHSTVASAIALAFCTGLCGCPAAAASELEVGPGKHAHSCRGPLAPPLLAHSFPRNASWPGFRQGKKRTKTFFFFQEENSINRVAQNTPRSPESGCRRLSGQL